MVASRLKPARIEHVVDGLRLRAQLSAAYAAEGENARGAVRNLLHGALFRGRMVAKERLEAGENRSEERRVGKECRARWAPDVGEETGSAADGTERRTCEN